MSRKVFIFLLILFVINQELISQQSNKELPMGYNNIELGMSVDETKDELLKNSDFGYHGDRDVSLLPDQQKVLIETDATKGHGSNFLNRCWFQFYNDELYIITINVNPEKMDYYSIFTTLCKKYGDPDTINPQKAVWKNSQITMSLEKPLTLKYIDNEVYDSIQQYSSIQKSSTEITRDMFLDEL